ncbi:MAG TPA: hypothetical protein VMW36_03635 [Patescibacteria group bacterium]|nr:hypothetical protein [Patescibacteria group bacterium]
MIKKQIGFQIAVYEYSQYDVSELKRMRDEVQEVQKNGWEVQPLLHLGVRKNAENKDVDAIAVPMVKYKWVDENYVSVNVEVPKKVGRPKKA